MVDSVTLCNMALSYVGTRSTISSLNEDSGEANQCKLFYEAAKREFLRSTHWSFARREVSLSLLASGAGTPENPSGIGTLPATPWAYQYAYPSDCLRVRYIKPEKPLVPFVLSGAKDNANNEIRVILTNTPQAEVCYTADVPIGVFDPEASEALAVLLASKIAFALTGNGGLASNLSQSAMIKMRMANASDGNEQITTINETPEWITARGNGGI